MYYVQQLSQILLQRTSFGRKKEGECQSSPVSDHSLIDFSASSRTLCLSLSISATLVPNVTASGWRFAYLFHRPAVRSLLSTLRLRINISSREKGHPCPVLLFTPLRRHSLRVPLPRILPLPRFRPLAPPGVARSVQQVSPSTAAPPAWSRPREPAPRTCDASA